MLCQIVHWINRKNVSDTWKLHGSIKPREHTRVGLVNPNSSLILHLCLQAPSLNNVVYYVISVSQVLVTTARRLHLKQKFGYRMSVLFHVGFSVPILFRN